MKRTPGVVLTVAAIVLAVGFVAHARHWQFTQDDAYISLRYARNLVEGEGLVFNPGERVEGYSNFSWTLLLAALLKLGAPAVEASRWLGIAFGALAALAAARLGRAVEGRWGAAALAGGLLVAANPAFALWSTGGLETAFFAFLITAGLERGLAPGVGARGRAIAPLLFALAALTRPDGPLVFGLWFLIRAHDTWRGGPAAAAGGIRELVRDVALFCAPLVPYTIWKVAYYGDLLPNTYYAKAGVSADYLGRGGEYALDWFRAYGIYGAAPLLAVYGAVRSGASGLPLRLLFLWCGVAAYVIAIGGDVLLLHRFWLPILPVAAVLIGLGVSGLAGRFARGPATLAVAAVLLGGLASAGILLNAAETRERRDTEDAFVAKMSAGGAWLREHLGEDATIAITTIGAMSYTSGLRVIDMLGLTDREIARNPRPFRGLTDTWRERKYNAESVLRRRPDAILFSTDIRPSSSAERALYLHEDFHRSYYAMYYRSIPEMRQKLTCFRLRSDAGEYSPETVSADRFDFIEHYIDGHLTRSRQPDVALEHFRAADSLGPDVFDDPREWQAIILEEQDDPAAEAALADAVARDPWSVAAHVHLANRWLVARRDEDAEKLYRRVVEINSPEAEAWAGLAEVERRRGNLARALELNREAVARWSASPAILLSLGNVALQNGEFPLAAACYQRITELTSADDPVRTAAGRGAQALQAVRSGAITLEQLNESARQRRDGAPESP